MFLRIIRQQKGSFGESRFGRILMDS